MHPSDHFCLVETPDQPITDFFTWYEACVRVWMRGYEKGPDLDEYEVALRLCGHILRRRRFSTSGHHF